MTSGFYTVFYKNILYLFIKSKFILSFINKNGAYKLSLQF